MTRTPTEMELNVMVALWHRRNKWREREGYGPPGDAEKQELWEDARAAIRAMREPTTAMVREGGMGSVCTAEEIAFMWQTMIDEASSED